ncbi:hypothetical protein F5Y06DRAFT_241210 [Hypoxylon sp. FL0890]|nr:hypothetical protein F5Y06DRAFT_241210 [Hypoxylon sp. FL0890]
MSLSKQRISSPLEAGPSIIDAYNLPSHLTGALEYASKRLARKALHITLVVVRKEYQLPSVVPPCPTPTSPPLTPGLASPTRFTSPVAGLRQLVRRGTSASTSSLSSAASDTISSTPTPTFPPPPSEPLVSPRWAVPPTPGSPMPRTPMTPATPSSIVTASSAASSVSQGPNEFGIRLVYTGLLSPKAEKTLRTTILKAERKFRIGTGWLPPATTASACGLNADLVRRSILQNEVLFSSEGLTLLGLDRLYTFKSALAAYARSINSSVASSPLASPTPRIADSTRIEDAVDSLRRLVLANGGRPVSRSDLYRSYDWLGVNARALRDVESMYRRAYGGPERIGAFEITQEEREREATRPAVKIGAPPPPKTPPKTQTTPVLKLNTQLATATTTRIFKPKAKAVPIPQRDTSKDKSEAEKAQEAADVIELEIKIDNLAAEESDEEEEEEERTARPIQGLSFWNGASSIDELLSPCDTTRQSQRLGPTTPNGYDDISPITRGEWGFLFKGDGWTQGRTAAVETC